MIDRSKRPSSSVRPKAEYRLNEIAEAPPSRRERVGLIVGRASRTRKMGLRIGLLIRGGLSFRQMYHQEGVVFGEAMVDAHSLEKTAAVYPRIVVSERVLAKLERTTPDPIQTLLQDADGRWHLNYLAEMTERHLI